MDIAVIIPCYNESLTIASVVQEFLKILPEAKIYVYDNNSTDDTFDVANKAGAIVRSCKQIGKGNVVNAMINDIDADYYIMVDGDNTYDISNVNEFLSIVKSKKIDLFTGVRSNITTHALGNKFFNKLFNILFRTNFSDIFSGYRIMSKRFAKSFIGFTHNFEVETELSLHAYLISANYAEGDVIYKDRIKGSTSKLSAIKDGIKILIFILKSFLEFRSLKLLLPITFLFLILQYNSFNSYITSIVLVIIIIVSYSSKTHITLLKQAYRLYNNNN